MIEYPPAEPSEPEFRARLQAALGDAYELGGLIGEGGFGRVYRARDRRLEREVAIKALRPDLTGARIFLDRFRKEGIALAKLRHPGIVPIYDILERDGLIGCVMPFIEGQNLRARLERGRLAPKEVQRILSELCDSVNAAHRAGIVHRDIKPDNVILEGFLGKVLLMDFGIAKSLGDFEVTASGLLVGTPTYMSPEQTSGDTAVDHRADIYSLGVLGYHLLTGQPPFRGTTPQQIMLLHLTAAATPIRELNPSVPKVMADAIHRCLAKEPLDRFDSVMELWSELQRVSFFPPLAAPDPARPIVSRNSYLLGWLAVACLTLAAFGTGWLPELSTREFLLAAALCGALAALFSPGLHPTVEPGDFLPGTLRSLFQRFSRRRAPAAREQDPGPHAPPET